MLNPISEFKRKLVTVETIKEVKPHNNAENLELVTVRGWQVVVKRGEFEVGDRCIYCEIDSVLPEQPEFEFLREKKFRVRTIKLRGELSQGICFPISILSEFIPYDGEWKNGDDVTEELGVTLYSAPIPSCLGGDVNGPFPNFVPKTDCERIQNNLWILDELATIEWVATEKLDGSSCTVYWENDELHVCSRNWEMREDSRNAYWQAANYLDLKSKLKNTKFALQGELIGPRIQENRYSQKNPTVVFFDVFDLEHHRYLNFVEFQAICLDLDLDVVPTVSINSRFKNRNLERLLSEADGCSDLNSSRSREGVVWKPMIEAYDRRIGRVMFKVISNNYLLKS